MYDDLPSAKILYWFTDYLEDLKIPYERWSYCSASFNFVGENITFQVLLLINDWGNQFTIWGWIPNKVPLENHNWAMSKLNDLNSKHELGTYYLGKGNNQIFFSLVHWMQGDLTKETAEYLFNESVLRIDRDAPYFRDVFSS